MRLIENSPVDTARLERLIENPEDLHLVWPKARIPFDHAQWREVLDAEKGCLSFWVEDEGQLVGHAALDVAEENHVRMVRFLFIVPEKRDRGRGGAMLELLACYARETLEAKRLVLRVRSFNARALRCYKKSGFSAFHREGTLILMGKDI